MMSKCADTKIEHAGIVCCAHTLPTAAHYLRFEGKFLLSLLDVYFGLHLSTKSTLEQAQALAAQITTNCPAMFGQFVAQELDGFLLHSPDAADLAAVLS